MVPGSCWFIPTLNSTVNVVPSVVTSAAPTIVGATGAASVDVRVMVFCGSATPAVDTKFVRVRVRVVPAYNGADNGRVMDLSVILSSSTFPVTIV